MLRSSGRRSVFRALTWNCRGLLVKDVRKRAKKLKQLSQFLRNADYIFLQEVHGTETLLLKVIRHLLGKFYCYCDIPSSGSGGVACLVRKTVCPCAENITHHSIVPGRIHKLTVSVKQDPILSGAPTVGRLVFYGIHNFGISPSEFLRFRNSYTCDCDLVDADPSFTILNALGDFNYDPPGEFKGSLDS